MFFFWFGVDGSLVGSPLRGDASSEHAAWARSS